MNRREDQFRPEPPPPPAPPTPRDPRLEIPEILRKPIDHPSLKPKPVSPVTSGLGDLGKALSIGLDFLFTATAGAILGWLIDRWWGTSPFGLMIGLGGGFLAATFRIIQRTNREEALEKARREADGERR